MINTAARLGPVAAFVLISVAACGGAVDDEVGVSSETTGANSSTAERFDAGITVEGEAFWAAGGLRRSEDGDEAVTDVAKVRTDGSVELRAQLPLPPGRYMSQPRVATIAGRSFVVGPLCMVGTGGEIGCGNNVSQAIYAVSQDGSSVEEVRVAEFVPPTPQPGAGLPTVRLIGVLNEELIVAEVVAREEGLTGASKVRLLAIDATGNARDLGLPPGVPGPGAICLAESGVHALAARYADQSLRPGPQLESVEALVLDGVTWRGVASLKQDAQVDGGNLFALCASQDLLVFMVDATIDGTRGTRVHPVIERGRAASASPFSPPPETTLFGTPHQTGTGIVLTVAPADEEGDVFALFYRPGSGWTKRGRMPYPREGEPPPEFAEVGGSLFNIGPLSKFDGDSPRIVRVSER